MLRSIVGCILWLLLATSAWSQSQSSYTQSLPGTGMPAVNSNPAFSTFIGAGRQGVIASFRGANFNTVADQAIAIPAAITAFRITAIVVTNCSASLTLAAGGFYPAASKAGTPIVAATQLYSALTASTLILLTTLSATATTTRYTVSNIYFALTTAQGGAATCDIYVEGVDLT